MRRTFALFFLFTLTLGSPSVFAQDETEDLELENSETSDLSKSTRRLPEVEVINMPQLRHFAVGTYAPTEMWVPNKIGVAAGTMYSRWHTVEAEYLRGSLGALFSMVKETKISLIGRSYVAENSFNLSYGIAYTDLYAGASASLFGQSFANMTFFEFRNLAAQVALGNRWEIGKNLVIGVDWLTITQPFYQFDVVNNPNVASRPYDATILESDDALMRTIASITRIGLLKMQFGMRF
ncbi:MAG: hypothetical protein K2X47_10420 [Bdellovibrionales bacterium]|nr:hypothetical protein [Bdellovibrionales bacterium]